MRIDIVDKWAVYMHGACNNLLSPTKGTGTMLNKQRLTADQRIPQTRGERKRYVRAV